MPNFNADVRVAQVGTPPIKVKANKAHGRVRVMEALFVVPAAGLAIGDTITWGEIPAGSRVFPHLSQMQNSAGTASSTINIGDADTPARYLAATSVASAATTTLTGSAASTGSYEVTNATKVLVSVVAGAALQAGQTLRLTVFYALD